MGVVYDYVLSKLRLKDEVVVGGGGGSGTVTGVSVATDNGFAGSSDGDPSNPTITIETTVTGILKGDGIVVSAAVADTDYATPEYAVAAAAAKVTQVITNGVTTTAPSEDAVFDALALKYDASNPSAYISNINAIAAGGELSGTYPNPSVLNSAVLAKVLTGLNVSGSSLAATDNILEAFGKVQSQINSLLGGVTFVSTYNATTDTPDLADGVGTKGHYYVVAVAGSQDYGSGVIVFNVGDWVIYNGTIWQKVDNTDAVSSVNGYTGAVSLTSADISEVTNLYFTTARVLSTALTGYVSGAGAVAATDTVLQAIQKLNGNIDAIVSLTAANLATVITAASNEATPLDADEFPFYKIVGTVLKKVTWANVKTTLLTYFDTVYTAIALARIGPSTYSTVQHAVNFAISPGVSSGGVITDAGGGNVDISAGTGFIKATDSNVAQVLFFDWSASLANAIPNDTVRYIGVRYNAGAPDVIIKTTDTWDLDTEFPLGTVVNEAGTLYVKNIPWIAADNNANLIERADSDAPISRDNRDGGLILSTTGVKKVAVSAGSLMSRMSEFAIAAFDTNVAGTFTKYYGSTNDGTGTDFNNSHYNNAGTKTALTALYFTDNWYYLMVDGTVAEVLGTAQYSTLAALLGAELTAPSTLPNRILKNGVLIGRIVIQNGSSTPAIPVQSAYSTNFSGSFASNHNDLANLNSGDYLHLTAAQYAALDIVEGRYKNLFIDAASMTARVTNGAAGATEEYATNDIMSDHYLFDSTTEEGVQFRIAMPDEWDLSTIKYKVYWDAATGASAADTVSWGVKAGALSNDDAIDAALGTQVVVNDVVIAVGDLHVSPASGALTIGGTPALGDLCIFQIVRNVSGTDDMTEDAKLLGISIQFKELTTNPVIW